MVPDRETPTKATHGDPEELQAFAESTQKPEKKSVAQQLVQLAFDCYDLGVDTDDKPFAVRKGGHVTRPLKGGKRALRKELGGLFYRTTGRTASQNALAEAMEVLEHEATEGEPRELSLRIARPNDHEIYVDLGDQTERVVHITPEGWQILDGDADVPVLFRRSALTLPLPTPEPDGDLDQLHLPRRGPPGIGFRRSSEFKKGRDSWREARSMARGITQAGRMPVQRT